MSTSWRTTTTWAPPWRTRDKAIDYCIAAGERALRLLAFEEAVVHFTRSLEVAEQFGARDQAVRCDALLALAEAQDRKPATSRRPTRTSRRRRRWPVPWATPNDWPRRHCGPDR